MDNPYLKIIKEMIILANAEIDGMRQLLDTLETLENTTNAVSTTVSGDFKILMRCQLPELFQLVVLHMEGEEVLHVEWEASEMTAYQTIEAYGSVMAGIEAHASEDA